MYYKLVFLLLFLVGALGAATPAHAAQKLGIHILHPTELTQAKQLLSGSQSRGVGQWHYVTVPFSLKDAEEKELWASFFKQAKNHKIIPLVRLVTKFENGSWKVPNRAEIVHQLDVLATYDWPSQERYVIIFNEVNRASEWGGSVDAHEYGEIFEFAARWAQTQTPPFQVLPAGLDLAAPSNADSLDAFVYWKELANSHPEVFDLIDGWNSHAYPNPAFSAPPTYLGRDGITGFRQELDYVDSLVARDLQQVPIFITETGWREHRLTRRHLEAYYRYAAWHVWVDPQVKAVTPFVLRGDPGPFSEFSFIDRNGVQTLNYSAYQGAIESLLE